MKKIIFCLALLGLTQNARADGYCSNYERVKDFAIFSMAYAENRDLDMIRRDIVSITVTPEQGCQSDVIAVRKYKTCELTIENYTPTLVKYHCKANTLTL